MEVARSHLDQLEELEQPLEGPKPPPPTIDKPKTNPRPQPRKALDEDPYKPEKYEVEIFRLMEETINGETKPSRFTVLDNAIDVVRQQLDVYEYAVYTLLYRFSYGYSRCTCAFSYGQIGRELHMSAKKAEQVLAQLESRKLIEILFPPFKKFRGKVYKVKLPREFVREHEAELTVTEAFQTLRNMGLL
jgi:hypothetical protein